MKSFNPFNLFKYRPRNTKEAELVNARYMESLAEKLQQDYDTFFYFLKQLAPVFETTSTTSTDIVGSTPGNITVVSSGGVGTTSYMLIKEGGGFYPVTNLTGEFDISEAGTYKVLIKDELGRKITEEDIEITET